MSLTLDGATADLGLLTTELTFPEGQGGLPIPRLEVTLAAALPVAEVAIIYRDDNDPERDGWREIIMQAGADRQL